VVKEVEKLEEATEFIKDFDQSKTIDSDKW
jgi:hypothetical protein